MRAGKTKVVHLVDVAQNLKARCWKPPGRNSRQWVMNR